MMTQIYRSIDHRILSGVCFGLATFFKLDPSIVRLFFIIFGLISFQTFLFYIACVIIIPEDPDESIEIYQEDHGSYFPNSVYYIFLIVGIILLGLLKSLQIPFFTFYLSIPFLISFLIQILFVCGFLLVYHLKKSQPFSMDQSNKIILGVCSGYAESIQIPVVWVRLFITMIIILLNITALPLILAYFIVGLISREDKNAHLLNDD